MTTVTA
ncbi:Protein of unknown function [Propionibacterium freudenreichii]|nr:Protein of unknown function [Propionibacterium freudenreichii]